MTSRSRLLPALVGVGVGAAVLLVNVLGGGHDRVPIAITLHPAADVTATVNYAGAGVVLAPPPAGSIPVVTATGAMQAYANSGMFPGVAAQASGPADVRLTQFSDNVQGQIQPNNSVKLTYQNVLAWAVIYHGVPYQGVANPAQGQTGSPIPEDIVIVVDAASGKVLEAFADNVG